MYTLYSIQEGESICIKKVLSSVPPLHRVIFQTHKFYGDYPMFGVDLDLPADLEGDPKDGKPVFRIRPRSEIIEHVSGTACGEFVLSVVL